MYLTISTIFNNSKIRTLAERLQKLEYKYETVSYVENLIKNGKI